MQPILCKDSANRKQKRQARLKVYAEVQPILCKDSANEGYDKRKRQNFNRL